MTAARGISEQQFEPKPDERGQCQWCDYKQICPAFAGKNTSLNSAMPMVELSGKVDKLGKLDARLAELQIERAVLAEEVNSTLKASNQNRAQGKHFSAKLEKFADGAPDRVAVEPLERETLLEP